MLYLRAIVSLALVFAASIASAADDSLARARQLYNDGKFEAAIEAAEQARLLPAQMHLADLVAARAYLERFRSTSASDDLTNARERFRRISPTGFTPRERGEYIVGLAETLFFEGAYGASASVFDSVLQGHDLTAYGARERVLDWWATAVDRDARPRPEAERQAIYKHLRERLEGELTMHPDFGAASFWLAAATRAQGDLQTAWDAALAGWVRAPLSGDGSVALRADLDRLMQTGIIPDRARAVDAPVDALQLQWEEFKERWRP
jgi:hypothetical protein